MHITLPAHVHMAQIDGDLVFLDARRNQYSCVARGGAASVYAALGDGAGAAQGDPVVAEMMRDGLVLPGRAGGAWTPLARAAPHTDFHQIGVPDLEAGLGSCLKLGAAATAGWLQSVRARPEAWLSRARGRSEGMAVRAASLALQFDRLRPYFPYSGRCLPSSIMLLAFLRRHGIEADWVFGVRTFPFDAHCWVELDGVVLNDVLEHVGWFTPIAAS